MFTKYIVCDCIDDLFGRMTYHICVLFSIHVLCDRLYDIDNMDRAYINYIPISLDEE